MDNIFKVGQIVYAKENPDLKLKVRRYLKRIYYCEVPSDPAHKDFAYYERELSA